MVKKILLKVFTFWALILTSFVGLGQECPTSVSLSVDPGTSVCEGTPITFTASISGGSNYTIEWQLDGTSVGTNSKTYTVTNPQQGQQVTVVVKAGDQNCTSRTSSSFVVNTKKTPTVSITPTKATICPGESISFSAGKTNEGSSPTYEWFVNGNSVQQGSSSTLSSPSGLVQGDNIVRVVMKSSLACVTSDTAEAELTYNVKPIATISATTATTSTTCINSTITPIKFDIGGGGTGANVSGLPAGVSGSFSNGVYTISGSPTTAGIFDFTVNTTGTCDQTSATGTITVNPDATLSLTSGNNNQTVCAAGGVPDPNIAPITYNIGETGNGATVTGLPAGITDSYSSGILTISGSSTVVGIHNFTVTATGDCGPSSALTGSITITENLQPSVTITSSDADNNICAGTEVNFTATPTNGGSSPTYQWQIDGNNTGSGTNIFTTSSLTDGQTVTVVMTSNETCRTENTATSNGISTKVNPNLEPSVSIEASDSDFCAGDEVTYTAIPVNGGNSPTFQWKIGSTVMGSGETFTSSTLTNNQSIIVTLTSSETCVTSATAVSDPVVTSVSENLYPSVSISSNDDNNIICAGESISFTATPVNGGTNPQYQWQINESASGSITTSNSFSPENLTNGDKVSVVLTSSEECLADNDVVSNEIKVQVDNDLTGQTPQWDYSNLSHNPTAICPVVSGLVFKVIPVEGATSYKWTFPNSGWTVTSGAGTEQITVTAGTNASGGNITVTAQNECGSSSTQSLAVTTGTVVHVEAGPDTELCPGTTTINLAGEIGGVITKHQDWDWYASVNGGEFNTNGFSGGGNSLTGTYTIPQSVQTGGTVVIRIQSIDPAGPCEIKTDDRVITIQSAASITDPSNKNQTVCVNAEIEDVVFTIGGAGKGATATGLPEGISGNFVDGNFTLSGSPTKSGTFDYTVTTTGNCTNTSRSGTLTVNPRPTFTQPEEVFVCAGENTSVITFGGSTVTGTTYTWINDNTSIGLAANGTGDIAGFNATNSTDAPISANITVTPSANNCEGTPREFKITVYPSATMDDITDLEVCSGAEISAINFSGSAVAGTTYEWENDNPSIGLAASGTGNIAAFSTINNTVEPLTANITVTPIANGCEGTPQEFTITVNPDPSFTAPGNITVCNGEQTSIPAFAGETVSGTTYTWTNNNSSIGLASSGEGNLPDFTAVNTGDEPVTAAITITPEVNGCHGEPLTFQVTVNPTPTVNLPESIVLCNGEEFSGLEFSGNVEGTTYSWSNDNTGIGLAANGNNNIPVFTAINNTDVPVTAIISIVPAANNCEGNPQELEIVINPSSKIDAGPDQIICSNGTATMNAVISGGATGGEWSTSGSGTFSDNSATAVYTQSASDVLNGSVVLTFTTNDPEGPCGPASDTLELFINEEVVITTQPENIGVCSTEPSELTVIASGDNLSYEWKRTDGADIINSNGIYSSTLSFDNTTSTNSGEYYVVVKGEDACNDEDNPVQSTRVTITVDENIIIDEPSGDVPICGDGFSEASMRFVAHANGAPLSFTWFKDGEPVDLTDPKISLEGPSLNADNKYEGTLRIEGVTVDYNGDYYVEISGPEEFTCSTAVTNPFQLRLNAMPSLPEVEDLVVCQNEIPEAFTVNLGTDLKWYLNESDTEHIVNDAGQPTAPVPPTDVPGEYYYWVTQTPEACESEKVQVKVTVKEKPGLPEVEESIYYCLGDTADEISATGLTDTTLNWYDSNGEALSGAPTPDTQEAGETVYFVSQTPNDGFGCESERAEVTVNVYPLPVVTAKVAEEVICLGTAAELSATGGISYVWFDGEEEIGSGASLSYTPEVAGAYTFSVLVTDDNGCENTAQVNVQVDESTVAGTLTGPASVCTTSRTGTLNLSGITGQVQYWEKSIDGGANWTKIEITSESYTFNTLDGATSFRAIVKNGVCDALPSNQVDVTIDPLPVGGELAFVGNGRVFTICENPVGNYAVDLNLTGKVGEVVRWGYRSWDATTYTDLVIDGELFTGTTLTAAQIQNLGFNETTVFQVEVGSGVCSPDALSKTAILSVIPSDITPSPVTVDPGVVCLGEEVTLSSETGYETGGSILDQGAFDNASITSHGWRIRREGISGDIGFDTDANNTEFDRWKRATPRAFTTASINSPYNTSGVVFDTGIEDGNKGFALISGNYRSTMETPVFTIGSMDQAVLTFDQAYVLTPSASLKVEISTDGGSSYTTLYVREVSEEETQGIQSGNFGSFGSGTIDSRPENKILVDLGDYMGRPNLRIRFNYSGARPGDIWAVDNIDVPEGPNGITMEWRDYTDPNNPEGVLIGNNNVEKWTPTKVGLNVFEIKTKLVYNSNGDACEVAENAQRVEVFVFDEYTTTVEANYGSCGNLDAQLTAMVTNGNNEPVSSYPTPDGYVGRWEIEGNATLVDSDLNDGIDAINDPNAILSTTATGTYVVSWILEATLKDENGNLYENPEGCPPVINSREVVIEGCTALDFDGVNDYVDLGTAYAGSSYSIEAWIRPFDRPVEGGGSTNASTGTIISGPGFEIKMEDLPDFVQKNDRWYHIVYTSGEILYIDGIPLTSNNISNVGGNETLIGARWNSSEKKAENHFSGWIEEVRIWKGDITQEQIRFLMNQRLQSGAHIGVEIPMPAPGLSYDALSGYFQLLTTTIANGNTPNLGSGADGRLHNMETIQENTAPLPYTTFKDNHLWTDEGEAGPWTNWDVWDIPHANGINGTPITWNIVRTSNYLESGNKDIIVLGLIVESNELDILNPSGAHNETNSGQSLEVTHYLDLDGILDLTGESQLLQPKGSILDSNSSGYLERDQQGKRLSYNYNYWSSPVSALGAANNADYSIGQILLDGTTSSTPKGITFGSTYGAADGARQDPITLSSYWMWKFKGSASLYEDWLWVGENNPVKTGEGFTLKGTDGNAAIEAQQNYVFKGKPHNGEIILPFEAAYENYLVGNPYPSAIDANQFIKDNLVGAMDVETEAQEESANFNGTLYFWSHFAGKTHYLQEYVGGYAMYNLSGGVVAASSIDQRINNNGQSGGKMPEQFIPVGQGFFVNKVISSSVEEGTDGPLVVLDKTGGNQVIFNNSQRVFEKESHAGGESVFHSQEGKGKKVPKSTTSKDGRSKIWLRYSSPKKFERQILVTADPGATENFDLGYDAPLIEDNAEDMFWFFNNSQFVIQGVPDFNLEQVLPLGFKVAEEGKFSIGIDELRNIPDDMEIYVKDSLLGVVHDLRKGEYKADSEAGTFTNRFSIVFQDETVVEPEPQPQPEDGPFEILYVNGTRDILIRNPQMLKIEKVYLNNMLGQQVHMYYDIQQEKETRLPVKRFGSGVYVVKVHSEQGVTTKKVILE